MAPPRTYLLAPVEVALWIPTFHHHPYPLVTREFYAFVLDLAKPCESSRRLSLEAYVSGKARTDDEAKRFAGALQSGELELVCLRKSCGWLAEIVTALEAAGFVRCGGDSQYDIWLRKRSPAGGPRTATQPCHALTGMASTRWASTTSMSR
jgi:hypothetical protein